MPGDATDRSPSLGERLHVALSDVRARNRRLRGRFGRAFETSLLGALIHGLDRALEHSRLAAWFRRPPDGPVSVDLAESRVAWPLLALLGPLIRSVIAASKESRAAGALGTLWQSGGPIGTDTARSLSRNPTRVVSVIVLGAALLVAASSDLTADPIGTAAVALLAVAGLLGIVVGPRARLRSSVAGIVLLWLRGDPPETGDRSR